MGNPILLPRLGASMTHGTFVEWLVEDGSAVEAGEDLYSVATEKVETTVEAAESGILRAEAEPDQEFAVGERLGEIV
jgi:pyruvate/2-oxoglutarate dehydrogenase complex dihydrolipoamide acyltransferase (E2) component